MCRVFLLVISSASLALSEVEWVETRSNDEIRMTNDEGSPNDKNPNGNEACNALCRHSTFVINSSFVIRASSFPNWRFLNFVSVLCKFITKHAGKIDIVQNNQVTVVFLGVVVLPAFVPPAESDDCRPSI
jgi:hypothetical protein